METKAIISNDSLFFEIKKLIEESRKSVAVAVNAELTSMYWHIGKKINEDILNKKRAEYGKQVIASLSHRLTNEYGKGWSTKHLQHCLRFAETFPDFQIVSALQRQLSWSHFKLLLPTKNDLKRDFYFSNRKMEHSYAVKNI